MQEENNGKKERERMRRERTQWEYLSTIAHKDASKSQNDDNKNKNHKQTSAELKKYRNTQLEALKCSLQTFLLPCISFSVAGRGGLTVEGVITTGLYREGRAINAASEGRKKEGGKG